MKDIVKALGIATGAALLVMGLSVPAQAAALFYNGDHQGGFYASWVNNPANSGNQVVFDSFTIGAGQTWDITSVFGTMAIFDVISVPPVLHWEIREGMAAGSSVGTVVAGGSGAYTVSGNIYSIAVAPFALTSGTYWLGLYADMANTTTPPNGDPFIGVAETEGLNGVNPFLDGTAIWLLGADANNVGGVANRIAEDFSYGVEGTVTSTAVPEPASLVLLGSGLLAGLARRRARKA